MGVKRGSSGWGKNVDWKIFEKKVVRKVLEPVADEQPWGQLLV
jgi:hypothetical protein